MSDDERGTGFRNQILQRFNCPDVQMVRGLIQQQQVRLRGESRSQGCALALPTGAGRCGTRQVHLETLQVHRQLPVVFIRWRGQHRFLLDEYDAQPVAAFDGAIIQMRHAGYYFQQCRLTRAVAADEADTLAVLHGQLGMVKKREVAVGELRVAKSQ